MVTDPGVVAGPLPKESDPMKLFWLIVAAIGISGIIGIVYTATTSGDQTLVSGASGIAAMVPFSAAVGWWSGSRSPR